MASGSTNCACAYIVKSTLSYSDFVSWSNSILDGSVDGDVNIGSHLWHALHSFTNFMNNVVINVANWIVQCIIQSSNKCSYPTRLFTLVTC